MNIWNSIIRSFNENLRNKYNGTEDKENKISQNIDKGKTVSISNPTSQRTITKGENDFTEGQVEIGNTTADNNEDSRVVSRTSSAVENVEYNPKTNTASVTFKGGDKAYDYEVKPGEFNSFLNAPSKGQWIAKKWNHNPHFRKPGY
jgi:hypothetical protein